MIIHKFNKFNAPIFAITAATCLAVGKAIIGYFSGSLAILSSAVDSITDIGASFFNFLFIKKADEPPDHEHQFGHGKLESYATVIQSVIIFSTGVFVMYKALTRIMHEEMPVISLSSIGVMIFAIIVSFAISYVLKSVAKRENSQALETDAIHYSIDMLTNSGVLISIVIIKMTGFYWVDPIIAILMACYIMYSAVRLHLSALKVLLDSKISDDKIDTIKKVLAHYNISYKSLRTRSDGYTSFVVIIIELCRNMSLEEAHRLCDVVESKISEAIQDIDITIHPEPFDKCDSYKFDEVKAKELLSENQEQA